MIIKQCDQINGVLNLKIRNEFKLISKLGYRDSSIDANFIAHVKIQIRL